MLIQLVIAAFYLVNGFITYIYNGTSAAHVSSSSSSEEMKRKGGLDGIDAEQNFLNMLMELTLPDESSVDSRNPIGSLAFRIAERHLTSHPQLKFYEPKQNGSGLITKRISLQIPRHSVEFRRHDTGLSEFNSQFVDPDNFNEVDDSSFHESIDNTVESVHTYVVPTEAES